MWKSIPGSEGSGGGGAGNFNNGGGGGAGGNYGNKIPEKSNDTGNQKPPRKRIRVTANIKDSYGNLTPLQEEFLASLQEYANTERIESIRRRWEHKYNTRYSKLVDFKIKRYKKGGLVNNNGLAWLDGTKKKIGRAHV